jgi:enterochelin esterase family protein
MRFPFVIAAALSCAMLCQAQSLDDQYVPGPESQRQEGVPRGKVTKHTWHSKVFEGTIREFYLYVPAEEHQKDQTDFAVMVFQDGHTYVKEDGQFRVPVVFDNLIHKGDLPADRGHLHQPRASPRRVAARSVARQ